MTPLVALLVMPAVAQNQATPDPSGPVTRREVSVTLTEAGNALRRAMKMPEVSRPASSEEGAATRADIIRAFDAEFESFVTKFVVTPVPQRRDPRAIEENNPAELHPVLKRLVRYGAVAPVGPLVVGPEDSLSLEQYGDALAMLMNALLRACHRPDVTWSPRLQAPDLETP